MENKFFVLVFILATMTSCVDITQRKSILNIEDNDRHYYPIQAGHQMDVSFNLTNLGNNPLMITDVITSCGCLELNDGDAMFSIPPGKDRLLTLRYNSAKNIGYVKHYITLYGNFEDSNLKEIVFDVNVVPNALYTKDYEELYQEQIDREGGLKDLVEGANNKGYYTE